MVRDQRVRPLVLSDVDAGPELDALGRHLFHSTLHDLFLKLEVRDAQGQQAPDAVVPLEHSHVVAAPAELLRDGEASAFGGAGLVRDSQPEREWLETQLKIDAVAKHLVSREVPR